MSTSSGAETRLRGPSAEVEPSTTMPRGKPPVFVVGCPRSGTTLLYHMLLSAGDFAVYRAESNVFNVLAPRFGDLRSRRNRQKLMDAWLGSRMFIASGLGDKEIEAKILEHCRSSGDFFRIVMEQIARQQNVNRWADCTPEHVLYAETIQKTFPGAPVVHIIRDGRDVALSLARLGWIRPIVQHRNGKLIASALYWEWIVQKGRAMGKSIAPNYMEVRFEELVTEPRRVLAELGRFIDHDLDYDRIRRVAVGSVSQPNTSFRDELPEQAFNPLRRWERLLPPDGLATLERLIGDCLLSLGYPLTVARSSTSSDRLNLELTRMVYRRQFDLKFWLKTRTPLKRLWLGEDDRLGPGSAVAES
jgi:Sulfotransferase family